MVFHYVAQRMERYTAIDERMTRYPGYVISQRRQTRVEGIRMGKDGDIGQKVNLLGLEFGYWMFILRPGVYNLVCVENLGVTMG